MSVVPLPKPDGDPPETADAEGWALLDALRRRLDEQAAQTRKTQSQVTQLADSIAALVDVQRKRSRWLNLNSFVAYVMFTLLCGCAFYYLYQSRAHALVGERDRAVTERDAAVRRADEAVAKTAARDAADAKAWEIYQLLVGGKRDAGAKRLAELRDAPIAKALRELLGERAKQADPTPVDSALKAAGVAFRAGRFADVATPLEQALALEPSGAHAASMHYLAGVARARLGELDKAIAHLDRAVAMDVTDDDARFQLASALDRAGQWGRARGEYDRFATAHPQSPFAAFAMRRSATLARMSAQPVPAPVPVPVPVSPPHASPSPGSGDGRISPSPPSSPSPSPPPSPSPSPPPSPKPTEPKPAQPAPKPATPPTDPMSTTE